MRFPKKSLETISASSGKPFEIPWPDAAPDPQPGNKYSVQTSHRAADTRILVLFTDETREGWRVIARLDNDPVRLVGKSGGYVSSPAGAMATRKGVEPTPLGGPQFRSEFEPEAISEGDQMRITREAHARAREVIREGIEGVEDAISKLQGKPEFEHVRSDLNFQRNLARGLEAKLLSYWEVSPQ